MYDAILFDLDGTLIDTERLALAAGAAAFAELGHPDSTPLLHGLIGVDLPTASQRIRAAYPELDQTELNRRWRHGFEAAMRDEVPLKAHARRVVDGLAKAHELAVVTSSGREAALSKLDRAGLLGSFRLVIALEDVTEPKPAPEPYLLAAERLGVAPGRCLAFEDSETGAAAAHAAGMCVIQIPDMLPASGRFARHVATDLLSGAAWAGLSA